MNTSLKLKITNVRVNNKIVTLTLDNSGPVCGLWVRDDNAKKHIPQDANTHGFWTDNNQAHNVQPDTIRNVVINFAEKAAAEKFAAIVCLAHKVRNNKKFGTAGKDAAGGAVTNPPAETTLTLKKWIYSGHGTADPGAGKYLKTGSNNGEISGTNLELTSDSFTAPLFGDIANPNNGIITINDTEHPASRDGQDPTVRWDYSEQLKELYGLEELLEQLKQEYTEYNDFKHGPDHVITNPSPWLAKLDEYRAGKDLDNDDVKNSKGEDKKTVETDNIKHILYNLSDTSNTSDIYKEKIDEWFFYLMALNEYCKVGLKNKYEVSLAKENRFDIYDSAIKTELEKKKNGTYKGFSIAKGKVFRKDFSDSSWEIEIGGAYDVEGIDNLRKLEVKDSGNLVDELSFEEGGSRKSIFADESRTEPSQLYGFQPGDFDDDGNFDPGGWNKDMEDFASWKIKVGPEKKEIIGTKTMFKICATNDLEELANMTFIAFDKNMKVTHNFDELPISQLAFLEKLYELLQNPELNPGGGDNKYIKKGETDGNDNTQKYVDKIDNLYSWTKEWLEISNKTYTSKNIDDDKAELEKDYQYFKELSHLDIFREDVNADKNLTRKVTFQALMSFVWKTKVALKMEEIFEAQKRRKSPTTDWNSQLVNLQAGQKADGSGKLEDFSTYHAKFWKDYFTKSKLTNGSEATELAELIELAKLVDNAYKTSGKTKKSVLEAYQGEKNNAKQKAYDILKNFEGQTGKKWFEEALAKADDQNDLTQAWTNLNSAIKKINKSANEKFSDSDCALVKSALGGDNAQKADIEKALQILNKATEGWNKNKEDQVIESALKNYQKNSSTAWTAINKLKKEGQEYAQGALNKVLQINKNIEEKWKAVKKAVGEQAWNEAVAALKALPSFNKNDKKYEEIYFPLSKASAVSLRGKNGATNQDKELADLIVQKASDFSETSGEQELEKIEQVIRKLREYESTNDDKKKAAFKIIADNSEYKSAFDKLVSSLEERKSNIEENIKSQNGGDNNDNKNNEGESWSPLKKTLVWGSVGLLVVAVLVGIWYYLKQGDEDISEEE